MNHDTTSIRRIAGMLLAATAATLAWPGAPTAHARAAAVPDVQVLTVTPTQARTEAGWGLTVRATVRNGGNAASAGGVVRFSLSKDQRPGGDIALRPADVPLAGLEPRQKTVLPPTLDVPPKTRAGQYYVIACARVPGKDKAKANDCRASAKRVQVDAALQGDLTGQIVFDRASESAGGSVVERSSDHASVEIDVRVDGRQEGWDRFGNAGSSWVYRGSSERTMSSDGCVSTTTTTSEGSGPLRQTGDQYEDDLLGAFSRNDHSRIDLLIGLRYDYTAHSKDTPTTELGCLPKESTDGPRELRSLTDLDLRQVKKSGKKITYHVVKATDPYSTGTEWDTVTGTLTLTID